MQKLILSLILIISMSSLSAHAQPFFSFTKPTTPPPATNKTNPTQNVMSADEFKKTVNKLGQKTQSNVTKEAKQYMNQAAVPQPTILPTTAPSNSPLPTPVTPRPAAPPTSQPIESVPSNSPVLAPVAPSASPTPTAAPTPPPQPYTGFGSGTTETAPKNAPAQPDSSGWNIKY